MSAPQGAAGDLRGEDIACDGPDRAAERVDFLRQGGRIALEDHRQAPAVGGLLTRTRGALLCAESHFQHRTDFATQLSRPDGHRAQQIQGDQNQHAPRYMSFAVIGVPPQAARIDGFANMMYRCVDHRMPPCYCLAPTKLYRWRIHRFGNPAQYLYLWRVQDILRYILVP